MLEYGHAARLLRERPEQLADAWHNYTSHPAGSLFRFCTPSGRAEPPLGVCPFGCPLMVAAGRHEAWCPELTDRVRALRLPPLAKMLTGPQLKHLARLQRHMDETIRNRQWRKDNVQSLPYEWEGDIIHSERHGSYMPWS